MKKWLPCWHRVKMTTPCFLSLCTYGPMKLMSRWIASGSFTDAYKKDDVSYFQWTFTTENFAVLYIAGHVGEGYWLIEKLTPNELWVQSAPQDPVIYPNQDKRFYKFKARKISK